MSHEPRDEAKLLASHNTARYFVESPDPLQKVAETIAGEQSSGTFLELPGETAEEAPARDTGLATGTLYNRRLGNSYTASVFAGLAALMHHDPTSRASVSDSSVTDPAA